MPSSSRRSASASAATRMNALPRWLISMTDMPLACQSTNSSRACAITSVGSAAGPGAKLKTRMALRAIARLLGLGIRRAGFGRLGRRVVGRRGIGRRGILGRQSLDPLEAGQLIALLEANQPHALGVSTNDRNILDRSSHQGSALTHEHDLVVEAHLQRADHAAVAVGDLQRNDALAAAAVPRVFLERREFSEALLGRGQNVTLVGDYQRVDPLIVAQANAAHAGRFAAHRPHLVLDKADRLAAGRE